MKLLVFAASHRPDSYNRKLAKLAQARLQALGVETDFAEYAEFDMPVYNDAVADQGLPDFVYRFAKRAEGCKAIVIASPEYNWSYPGSLKNIIDWTSRIEPEPFTSVPALLLSATQGKRGGADGLAHLRAPLKAIGIDAFAETFTLPRCHEAFEGDTLRAEPRHQLEALVNDFFVSLSGANYL